jgi:hypothetical protein
LAPLTSDTAQAWLEQAQGIEISRERAADVLDLINPLAQFARTGATAISFDGEPGDFVRALRRWSRRHP